jgi:predicted ATPase
VRESVLRAGLAQPLTRFVGRRRELSEARTLLAEHRLVTVIGPPGIGKTRLACELARLLRGDYLAEGGMWRADLAEAGDLDSACAAIARALSCSATSPGRSPAAALGAALTGRGRTLIVLDAIESCGAALADAIAEWMASTPQVDWIVTTRSRIGSGEGSSPAAAERSRAPTGAVFELGPLALAPTVGGGGTPDAVALYLERARNARTGPAHNPERLEDAGDAHDAAEVVRLLEGVPLAIELTAANPLAWPPRRVLELRAGAVEAAAGALDGVVRRCCEQLEPWQADALAQLSVFAGGFDLEAAEAVLDLSAYGGLHTAAEALETLARRALLAPSMRPEDGSRVRFSIDRSVRQHARERLLELGAREATLARHANRYAAVGRVWFDRYDASQRLSEALAWMTTEADNLLAAHRRMLGRGREGGTLAAQAALAIDPLLALRGPGSVRLGLLDAVLALAEKDGVDPEVRIRALEARSDAHRSLGHGTQAVANAQAALALASASGQRHAAGRVLRTLATLALMQGRLAEGRGLAEQACAVDRETGHRREEGRAVGLLGSIEALEGDLETAWSTLDRAIALHRGVDDLRFEAIDVGNLAVVAHDAGRLNEARTLCERAITLSRLSANPRLEGEALGLAASVAHEMGRLDDARASYESARLSHREAGNRRAEGAVLSHYGVLLAELQDREGARAAYAQALAASRECRDRPNEAFVLGALAALEARERSLESARAALTHAAECLEGSCEPRARAALNVWRGHLELALARNARADGDESRAAMLIDAARRRLDPVGGSDRGEVRRVADVRLARRALSLAVDAMDAAEGAESGRSDDAAGAAPAGLAPDALVVCSRGRWFRAPGGTIVSVARWRPLQRLLERLAERREIAPGEPLPVEALVAAGWPGERMLPKAGATRVYTAIASLRRLGLKGMLVRDDRGYRLLEGVPISRVSRH